VAAQLQTVLGPRIEVSPDVDRATHTLLLPDAPELRERAGALNGWLVGSLSLKNIVSATINGDGALLLCCRGGVVAAVRLDDVVLDERVPGPAVKRNVAVDVCAIPGTGVGDGAGGSGVPALSGNKVVYVVPRDRVFASSLPILTLGLLRSHEVRSYLVVVGHGTLSISPEGVEEAIVGTSSRGGLDTTLEQVERRSQVDRVGEHRGSGAKGEEDRRESNHVDDRCVDARWFLTLPLMVLIYCHSISLGSF
jgi:hypothetical protein